MFTKQSLSWQMNGCQGIQAPKYHLAILIGTVERYCESPWLPQISLFILRIDAMWVVFMSGKKGKVSALSDYRVHGHCDFVGISAMYTECQRTKDSYVLEWQSTLWRTLTSQNAWKSSITCRHCLTSWSTLPLTSYRSKTHHEHNNRKRRTPLLR